MKLGETLFPVKGKSWFDRELSSKGLAKNEAGWDWFALQLDDGQRDHAVRRSEKKTGPLIDTPPEHWWMKGEV